MKKYKVTVKEKKPSTKIHFEGEELANTERQVELKWRRLFPFATIKIERLRKAPGIQTDLLEAIKEVENEQK